MPASAPSLRLAVGGHERANQTFARNLQMLLRCAQEQQGLARLWRAQDESLSLGRFHRRAPGSPGLDRRLSGGRIVPTGPGVQGLTLAVPGVDWLDPASSPLRPDQVLNRALRPLLELLRHLGVDVFYPGRDLVTARGRALAHASFTVARDGTALIEMHVAETASFAALPALLGRLDPAGVAAADTASMETAVSLAELGIAPMSQQQWAERLVEVVRAMGGGRVEIEDAAFSREGAADHAGPVPEQAAPRAQADDEAGSVLVQQAAARAITARPVLSTSCDEAAWRDHQDELGPAGEGCVTAAAPSMLGVVECSARFRGDRLSELRISGDVIAPFHTLDDLSAECEGMPFRMPQVRRVLGRVLSQPRSFILGVTNLDELIERLA